MNKPRTCYRSNGERKSYYLTRGDARRAAKNTKYAIGERIHAYRCPVCAYYHIGHYLEETV